MLVVEQLRLFFVTEEFMAARIHALRNAKPSRKRDRELLEIRGRLGQLNRELRAFRKRLQNSDI